jgi:hypothetical protein
MRYIIKQRVLSAQGVSRQTKKDYTIFRGKYNMKQWVSQCPSKWGGSTAIYDNLKVMFCDFNHQKEWTLNFSSNWHMDITMFLNNWWFLSFQMTQHIRAKWAVGRSTSHKDHLENGWTIGNGLIWYGGPPTKSQPKTEPMAKGRLLYIKLSRLIN